jgi:hypothetical protein
MHLRIAFSRMDSGISPHPQRVEGRPISAGIRSSSHFTASKDGFCRLFDLASFLRDVRHGSQSKRSITHSLPYFTWCFTSVALCGHSQHAVAQHRTPPSVFCWVAQPGPPSSGCISSFFPSFPSFHPSSFSRLTIPLVVDNPIAQQVCCPSFISKQITAPHSLRENTTFTRSLLR